MEIEALKSELDIFTTTPVQTSVEQGKWVVYNPISTLESNNTIEFVTPASTEDCIDLALTMIQVKVQVLKSSDGKPVVDTDNVAPVNNLLHSMFSQVEVYLNQKLVSPAANTYPYRSYIETLLNYDLLAKRTHLAASLWYKDSPGHFNDMGNNNTGYNKRYERSRGVMELYGPLFADIFNINKYLLTGVEMRVKLIRSRDSFVLMSDKEDYKLQILDATLHVRKARIAPQILLAHESALKIGTAKYPLTKTETKILTIGKDVSNINLDNVYLGQLPKRLILGLVTNSAFSGSFKKNPFEFGHHNLNYLSVYVDNEQFPSKPLKPDYNQRLYTMCYYTLFSETGIHFKDAGNDVSMGEYDKAYTLYCFDLTPDLSSSASGHKCPLRTGHLRIELGFSVPTTEILNCVIHAEFQSMIQIDQHRNVII